MGLEVKGKMIKRGEEVSGPEKKEEEVQLNPADYSCEVILEKTTKDKADDRKLPSDAFNVFYVVNGEELLDVTRSGKKVNVFDLYYVSNLACAGSFCKCNSRIIYKIFNCCIAC